MQFNLYKKDYLNLIAISIFTILIDQLFLVNINSPPAWDQGYHLSNLFKTYNIFSDAQIGLLTKFNNILNISDNYRGPLTYLLSAFILKIFDNTYEIAYLSNNFFNIICIFSLYEIGKIYKDNKTGIWASIFFTFSQLIIHARTDYLIDLSLTSTITLTFLFLLKWNIDKKTYSFYSLVSGFGIALIFLTKPTGIIYLIFPIIFIIRKKFIEKTHPQFFISELISFIFIFLLIIFPWFSKHWITIIGSILNAWNWGIRYQDGLDLDSLGGWIYYFQKIPQAFGFLNFIIIFLLFLIQNLRISNHKLKLSELEPSKFKINLSRLTNNNSLILLFTINFYLISSIMSTKDIRFIIPIYPILCLYFAVIYNSSNINLFKFNLKKYLVIFSLTTSFFLNNNPKLNLNSDSNFLQYWPHAQIIKEIEKSNPGINSVLAVLPDTKEINTFNLEAEAIRRGQKVFVRQIVSNEDSYKEDLKHFDWFLIKTNDQGVMTSKSKFLLQQYLINNSSFFIYKNWILSDKSQLFLYRRNILNSSLKEVECSIKYPNIEIKEISNGLNIKFKDKGKNLLGSNLLLDLISYDQKFNKNISIGQGLLNKNLDNNNCYEIHQNIALEKTEINEDQKFKFKTRLIDKNGEIKSIRSINKSIKINENDLYDNKNILLTNRINEVKFLGYFLKNGQFEKLFNLVGVLNQSDPSQIYLKDSEKLYEIRYKENKKLEDIYSILISQILQRKIRNAENTIQEIIYFDKNNGNAHLTKAIINIYLLNPSEALMSLKNAKNLKISNESKEILKIAEGLAEILNFNIFKGVNLLT